MGTYIGKVRIGDTTASVGSTLYGICSTAENYTTKVVVLPDFDAVMHGVTIFVKFINGNSASSGVEIQMGNGTYPVLGNCVCSPGEILSFTFDQTGSNGTTSNVSTDWHWITNGKTSTVEPATVSPLAVNTTQSLGSSLKYAREDHVHNIALAEGTTNGTVNIAGTDVAVHGLQTGAYADINLYAPKANPTFTGTVTIPPLNINGSNGDNEAANKKYVDDKIAGVLAGADAMTFKGTIGENGTINTLNNQNLPTTGYTAGWTYRVITAGTYAGQPCEIGDLIIAINNAPTTGSGTNADWTVVQGNLDGTVTGPASATNGGVALFDGTSGKLIQDSGFTLGKSVPADAQFTDARYTLTDGTAYTSHTLTGDSGASILAEVSGGVLTLAQGIKFTTGSVNATLNETIYPISQQG